MENFSTPRPALLPRAANLATLAVLACATWWSAAQRPQESAGSATVAASSTISSTTSTSTIANGSSRAPGSQTAMATPQTLALSAAHAPAGALQAGRWSAEAHALPREAMAQPVGFLQPALPH